MTPATNVIERTASTTTNTLVSGLKGGLLGLWCPAVMPGRTGRASRARESNSVCGRARADWPRFVYDGDPRPGDAAISDSARLPVWGSAGTRRRPTKVTPVQGQFVPTPTANGPRTRELS